MTTALKSLYPILKFVLLGASVVVLLALFFMYGVRLTEILPTEDYFYFRESAQMLWEGVSPYARPKLFYPLYTVVWLFTPLLVGEWYRWVWLFAPLAFLHLILGRKAILLWLFYPVFVSLRYGQVDGWLLLPIFALLQNSRWAPLGAALTLIKPQTAFLLVAYRGIQWLRAREFQKIILAIVAALILVTPAFVLQPNWIPEWLASVRAHPTEECQNATIWGWTCFGSIWLVASLVYGALVLYLTWRVRDRATGLFLLGFLITPILYAYDFILVTPTLKNWRDCLVIVIVSWLAAGLDILVGGWGGAYSLIPLTALCLRTDYAEKFFTRVETRVRGRND